MLFLLPSSNPRVPQPSAEVCSSPCHEASLRSIRWSLPPPFAHLTSRLCSTVGSLTLHFPIDRFPRPIERLVFSRTERNNHVSVYLCDHGHPPSPWSASSYTERNHCVVQ